MPATLILDTDIGTDVDDALALALALRHPGLELRAVTTVSGDAVRRARIARKLLRLAGRDDVEVAAGRGGQGPPGGRRAWLGHEGEGLLEPGDDLPLAGRDAVELLVASAGPDVAVATVGPQTNLAAALERDPSLVGRLGRLAVMGGVFAPVRTVTATLPPSADHNLNVDPAASIRVLNAGLPTLYVPLDVTVRAMLTTGQLERLRAGDGLCRALAGLVDRWIPVARHLAAPRELPGDYAAMLHDPLTVACVADRRLVTSEELPVTVAMHGGDVRTFVDPAAGRPAEVVTGVDGPAFAEFWLKVVLGG